MTNNERIKTDVVFVDTIIRECAMLTIQHEVDQQTIVAYKDRIADLEEEREQLLEQQVHTGQENDEHEELIATQKWLSKAKNVIEWLMAGGDPCKVCAKTCKMGEACKPVWKDRADI